MDERYATARELARLSERTATVEADMRQIGPALARIETAVATKNMVTPPQETAAALALHRAADLIEKRFQSGSSGQNPLTLFLSGVGLLAIGGGISWIVLHH